MLPRSGKRHGLSARPAALRRRLQRLIDRHEMLRAIVAPGCQATHPGELPAAFRIEELDLRGL